MAEVREFPLRHTQRHRADETDTTEIEFVLRKLEERREQRGDAWALEKYEDEVTKERDALLLEVEPNATITENIKKEKDVLRLEAEELRTQCKESSKLKYELNSLTQKCNDITQKIDALISENRITADNRDAVKKEMDALKREMDNLKAQAKDPSQLKYELNAVRVQCDDITKERDSLKLESRLSEATFKRNSKAKEALDVEIGEMRAQLEHYALLEKQLRTLRQECENAKKERTAFIHRAKEIAKSREATKNDYNKMKLEKEKLEAKSKEADPVEEKLKTAKRLCENMKRDRDHLKSKARWAGGNRKNMKEHMEELKLEIENLRVQCKKSAVLEKQLQTATQQCENIKKEKNAFILRTQRIAADRDSVRKERDHLKHLAETLRAQRLEATLLEDLLNVGRKDYGNKTKERDSLNFEVPHSTTDIEAIEEHLEDSDLEEDK
jgi:chromosome segregation ATPase